MILATSIVASEGSEYRNVFKGDQLLYSGVGKDLVKGNEALVNSMKHKTKVRVIRGFNGHHGKKQMFVMDGFFPSFCFICFHIELWSMQCVHFSRFIFGKHI